MRYDIINARWETVPSMNIARWEHSSLYYGGCAYVLCGRGSNGSTNTIEKLEIRDSGEEQNTQEWQVIVPPVEFLARSSFLVAPLNTSEIVIFGGLNWGHVATYLNDTWIFDTFALTFSQVASGTLANGMINKGS